MLGRTSKTVELFPVQRRLSFVLMVPLRYLRPSIDYSVPCGRIVQRAYCMGKSPIVKKKDVNNYLI